MDDTQKGEIVRFEEFGDSDIDEINRGHQIYLDVIFKEFNSTAMRHIIWPTHSNVGSTNGGNVGQEECWGQFATQGGAGAANVTAGQLLLIPRACSPAGTTATPTGDAFDEVNIHFHSVKPAAEVAKRINFNNKLHDCDSEKNSDVIIKSNITYFQLKKLSNKTDVSKHSLTIHHFSMIQLFFPSLSFLFCSKFLTSILF